MRRGEIYWADLGPPAGRRPVMILSRNAVIPVVTAVVVAPITRTIRGIASELPLGAKEGLPAQCVANCDNILTIPKDALDTPPLGEVGIEKIPGLDQAIRFALEVNF